MDRIKLASLLSILAVTVEQAAAAQPLLAPAPDAMQGVWAEGGCTDPETSLLIEGPLVMVFRQAPDGMRVAFAPVSGTAEVLSIRYGDAVDVPLPASDSLTRCETLPSEVYLMFGETIAVVSEARRLQDACKNGLSEACLSQAFRGVDVSGDGRLSAAEIGRVMRAATTFMSYAPEAQQPAPALDDVLVPATDFLGGSIAAIAAGPLLIGTVIGSYDFDGDGFLEPGEITQDRLMALAANDPDAGPNAVSTVQSAATAAIDEMSGNVQLLMMTILGAMPQ